MKQNETPLNKAFTYLDRVARDVADSLGNLSVCRHTVSLVQQAVGRFHGLKGAFELAATNFQPASGSSGSTGRGFKPFSALLFRAPELTPK